MKPYKTYECPVVEEDGELCLVFPDDMMDELDLKLGDVLKWERTINGWTLSKKDVRNND